MSARPVALPPAAPHTPKPSRAGRRQDSAASWRLTDRIGLGLAWALGLLFCAIVAAIVIYLLIQGIKFVRPSLLVTSPAVGYNENQTGGFLDPMRPMGSARRRSRRPGGCSCRPHGHR